MQYGGLQHLSIADLRRFGKQYGISYDFPQQPSCNSNTAILRGQVQEIDLSSGLLFTHSKLEVLKPYESYSTSYTGIFVLVVLEGIVQVSVSGKNYITHAGTAITSRLCPNTILHAFHKNNQQIRTITLALDADSAVINSFRTCGLESLYLSLSQNIHTWQIPNQLYATLQDWQLCPHLNPLQQKLLVESIALQLLADCIWYDSNNSNASLSPDEQKRLEQIRQQFIDNPCIDYSLESLASQAAMSPSSLRSKFKLMFGKSVFEYLRDQRLATAKEYLLQGYTVQQVANFCGYSHATNFATAFRKRYGIAPRNFC